MEESLRKNTLTSYRVLEEYQNYYDKAQNELNALCNKVREKSRKKSIALTAITPLILYLLLMSLFTIFNIFSKNNDENAFVLAYVSIKELIKAFTFQLGLGTASIVYGVYALLAWWLYKNIFNENYSSEYILNTYQSHPEFEEDFKRYQELNQIAYNFKQTERYKTDVSFIPVNYRNADIVAIFLRYIDDKRVDSLKEAINLYVYEVKKEESAVLQRLQLESNIRAEQASIEARDAAVNAEIQSRYKDSIDITIRRK